MQDDGMYPKVDSYGYIKRQRAFNMQHGHRHDYHELYYLVSGERRYFIGDRIFTVKSGDLVFIPRGALHRTTRIKTDAHERILVSVQEGQIPPSIRGDVKRLFEKRVVTIPAKHRVSLREHLLQMDREYQSGAPYGEEMQQSYVAQLLVQLLRMHPQAADNSRPEADLVIEQAAKYISLHFAEELTLTSAARQFAMSPAHFSRKFKQTTGFGFNEYLTHIRMTYAERLLRGSRFPITEVAIQSGFNDSNYFAAVFRKYHGVTPYKYRKMKEN